MLDLIRKRISESIEVKELILKSEEINSAISTAAIILTDVYKSGGKVILCGNGGSASDAEHIAGELVGRFQMERKALPAIAITSSGATITAIGNDYNFDAVFARQVLAHGKYGDALIAISTSGNSKGIINAILQGKKLGLKTIALLGNNGGECVKISDVSIVVPSNITARIQESHIMIGHILCEIVEQRMCF
jgi:D-sedoheptulose 7-phosphate isomerase